MDEVSSYVRLDLGFTHYCAKTRKNKFMVKRKTQAKRLARKLKVIPEELKSFAGLATTVKPL